MSDGCIFCRIVSGEIPAAKLLETEHALVFKDLHPAAPVHYLCVPKKHVASLDTAQGEDADALAGALLAVAEAARRLGVAESGYRVITNTNHDGGQEVFHLHFHLLAGRRMGRLIG